MSVRIVTDSTSDPTPDLLPSLRIMCVPLNVHFGNESFKDRVTLGSTEFFDRLERAHETPTTSLPAPTDFIDVYRKLVDEGADVVSLHISSHLSGTYGSAVTASREFGGKVRVVDTGHVSGSLFLLVQAAAKAAASGASADDVLALIERERARVRIYFALDTIEYLQRGGRLDREFRLDTGVLDVKPILTLKDGVIVPCARARTRRKALERAIEMLGETGEASDTVVSHARAPKESAAIVALLREKFPSATVQETEMGPVVGANSGPGCIAVAAL